MLGKLKNVKTVSGVYTERVSALLCFNDDVCEAWYLIIDKLN